MKMDHWDSKNHSTGSNVHRKLPATAALDRLQQSKHLRTSDVAAGRHRASLGGAMTMQMRKKFDTADLFSSLTHGDSVAFPEIKWCNGEEAESNIERIASTSHGQLHQQQTGATGHVLGGGFQKTQTWPRR